MTSLSELDKLSFLVGRWKSRTEDQFGEKGVLESTFECTRELGDRFLQTRGETRKDNVVINKAIDFITFDYKIKKYIRKRMWSYGFIENGEGQWEDDNTLMFQITYNNEPLGFEGTLWKSFIRKYSDNEIGHGLYTAKKGEHYKLYGESRATRSNR
jgi:hypothetical protein